MAEYLRHGALPKLGPEIPQYTSVFEDAKRFKRKVNRGRDFGVGRARKSRAEMLLKRANNLGGAIAATIEISSTVTPPKIVAAVAIQTLFNDGRRCRASAGAAPAKAINIAVPQSLLGRADELFE